LRSERDRFVALAFSWADVLLELDSDTRVVYAAGALEALLGQPVAAVIGKPLSDLVPPLHQAQLRDLLALARRRERIQNATLTFHGMSGSAVPLAFSGYHLAELNGHYFLSLRSTRAERKTSGFGRRSRDAETGLLDASTFAETVTQHLADAASSSDEACSLLVLPGYGDLRKRLTQTVERELLTTIAEVIREQSVDGESAARLGNDRYALLHSEAVDLDGLRAEIVSLTRKADPEKRGVAVNAATVGMDSAGLSPEQLATGVAHTIGRFRSIEADQVIADGLVSSISEFAKEAVERLNALQHVIAQREFNVAFQPVLDARTGSIHHYEALARFPEALGGGSPIENITFAEDTGIVVDLDLAMIQQVIDWMAGHLYTSVHGRTIIAVNLSGRSIDSLAFVARLDRLTKDYPWIRRRMVFEITEISRLTDLKAANNFIQRLREQGFFVGIDGFGSGAAHFSYLASLDVDIVKFAGAAIREAMGGHKGKLFLRALVDLCRELTVATVAEQVEDEATLRFVREAGVHYVQGFLFGQPAADMLDFSKGGVRHLFAPR
jgi:PAS domain S-box-containing protein